MSHPISTAGLKGGTVDTDHEHGESTGDWEARHTLEVTRSLPSGSMLTTSWTGANGPEEIETTRITGESDLSFRARHILDYTEAMASAPPIP